MSFTGQLGTSSSYLGNIELGIIGTPDTSVTIAGISSVTLSPNNVINCSLSIDGIALISRQGGNPWDLSLSIPSIASITETLSTKYLLSITISAKGSFATYFSDDGHLTISGISVLEFDILGFENPAGISSVNASANAIFKRTVTQTLNLIQSIIGLKSIINENQSLHLNQSIKVLHIHNPSVTQTLSFTQNAIAFRNISETLHLVQTITSKKIKNLIIRQTLNLISHPSRNIVSKHNIIQTLIFNPKKLINSQISTTSGRFSYYKPNLIVAKTNINKCLVTLISNTNIIDLPCPQLGDTQSYSGNINLKRTMTGLTYTYVKKSTLNKLNYTFNVGRKKSLELRDFIKNNSDKIITMHNWKGEIWYLVIINNPFDFTISERYQKEQEKVDIQLEFEGIKLA